MKLNFIRHVFAISAVSLLSGVGSNAFSQVNASLYDFQALQGTYSDLTGGTPISTIQVDEALSGMIPIGFDFQYCGVNYNEVNVSSNGWISFKSGLTATSSGNTSAAFLNTLSPAIAPLWDDLKGDLGTASYKTEGTYPNRVFTIEFKNWKWNFNNPVANISFQVKLHETSNKIRFIYNPLTSTVTSATASIGISGGGNYKVINNATAAPTASSTTFTTGINTLPAAGQIYEFNPPPLCNTATAGILTLSDSVICPTNTITATLPYNQNNTGFTYQLQYSENNTTYNTVGTNIAGSIIDTPTASGYYRVIKTCGTVSDTSNVKQFTVNPYFAAGTYTINPAQPTGGTNFTSFNDAIEAMNCGINGPVVFNVDNTTPYVGQIVIPDIPNTSATNTIRFNGNGATLNFVGNATTKSGLVLNGTKYVTLDSFNVVTTGPLYGIGVMFVGNAKYDSLINSTIDVSSVNSTAAANSAGITISGGQASATTASTASNIYIGNNTVKGGTGANLYYGITSMSADSVVIENNKVLDFYYYGVYMDKGKGSVIRNNEISRPNKVTSSQFRGIYVNGLTPNLQVLNNAIHSAYGNATSNTAAAYGVSLLSISNTAGQEILVANNKIYNMDMAGGDMYGIYMSAAKFVNLYHNTIVFDKVVNSTKTIYGIYSTGASNDVNIKNNLVTITEGTGGTKYGFYYATVAAAPGDAQRNTFYVASNQAGAQYYGYNVTPFTDYNSFITAYPTLEMGSVAYDPQFVDPTTANFLPTNPSIYASGLDLTASVPTDYLGITRINTPTVGAYELVITGTNNAGVITVDSPASFCAGPVDVYVKVQNAGPNAINNVTLNWELNGVAQTPVVYSTTIPGIAQTPNNQASVLLGNANITAASQLKVWTSMPNGVADTINNNDTLIATLSPSLSGTFTINNAQPTAGTNFGSIAEAITALETSGICGPVVFNVAAGSGPYAGNLTIHDVLGTSATNTITFNGNGATIQDSALVLLTLEGAKYVTIDSFNFKTLNVNGWGTLVSMGAQFDTIRNNTYDLTSLTATAANNANGIVFAGSSANASLGGQNGSNIVVTNNTILGSTVAGGPYYGISLVGDNNNNIIANNTIKNFHNTGIRILNGNNNIIENNDITREDKATTTIFYGIVVSNGAVENLIIRNNKMHGFNAPGTAATTAFYGIQYLGDSDSSTSYVYNNTIYGANNNGAVYGVYSSTTSNVKYLYNTVVLNEQTTTTSAAYGLYSTGVSPNTEFSNNLVYINGQGTGTKYGFYYSVAAAITDAQNNVFYLDSAQGGTKNYGYYITAYGTRNAFTNAYPNLEITSKNVDPLFNNIAINDFTPTNSAMFNSAKDYTAVVPTDINGQNRLAAASTSGVIEFPTDIQNNLTPVSIINPIGTYCYGVQTVKATIANIGSNDVTNYSIGWSVNGVAQPVVNVTNVLGNATTPGASFIDTITLGNVDLANDTNNIVIYTFNPNGVTDAQLANDTLITNLYPSKFELAATFDTVCAGLPTLLSLTPTDSYKVGDIAWEMSLNGITWDPINVTDTIKYIANNVTQDTYFRVKLNAGINGCYSDTAKISFVDPQLLTYQDVDLCGPGTATLNVTGSANSSFKWYTDSLGFNSIFTGSSFTTPILLTDTFFYVKAVGGAQQSNPKYIGTGSSNITTAVSPFFSTTIKGKKSQYMITAEELTANGFIPGDIKQMGLRVGTTSLSAPFEEFTIKAGFTTDVELSDTAWVGGLTTVYAAPTYMPQAASENIFTFTTPVYWDGMSNLVFEFCYQNQVNLSGTTQVQYTSTGINHYATHYAQSTALDNCTNPGGTTARTKTRPNFRLYMGLPCEAPVQKVVVKVNDLPNADLGPNISQCGPNGQTIVVSAPQQPANYAVQWSNGATTPSITVNHSSIYSVKITTDKGCVATDSVAITLLDQPQVSLPDSIRLCIGGRSTLDAGNDGDLYYWSNGAATQTIEVSNSGTYTVTVMNNNNCTAHDTVVVFNEGYMPSADYIYAQSVNTYSFNFQAMNTANVISYFWDFGVGTTSTLPNPTHTYAQQGDYNVRLVLSSICGQIEKNSTVHILTNTGVKDVENDRLVRLYPNPANDYVIVENMGAITIESIEVYNLLGQKVPFMIDTKASQSRINLDQLAAGNYNVMIKSNQGNIIRKLTVVK